MTDRANIFTPAPLTGSSEVLELDLLVMPQASLLTLGSVIDPLRAANRHLGRQAFRWRIVSVDGGPVALTCGIHLPADCALPATQGAVLLVLAGYGAPEMARRGLLHDLRHAATRARTLMTVDSGAWLLAATGLLDGCRVTTHWEDLEDFAAAFPEVTLVPDRYLVTSRCASAAGAGPAQDMMLDLIAARHGAALAMQVAGTFITSRRSGAESQLAAIATGRRSGGDPRVAAAIARMETLIDQPETAARTAWAIGIPLRHLQRLFATEIGMGPGQYALELRLQAARRMVTDTRHPLSEVALRCGFSAQSALSRAFTTRFGQPPSALR
ncbi:helix-turn-helix domain-containing protein [Pseudooceanicola sediminis]|uniref:Helix-turn-helix domain-containing protein n=1 Tax=Pseudooceanicola sediminis TaxID=2211117 RepID=A0A399J0L4_9RHOB|nr:helix-turn-helix domain-containing protein [Pseudooceanicola sediminis]KAA2316066.1 helix-turn-helix domain-containing protein [Puniceibacterium sp. HSS470]RII38177.1 helix-turn-helix domain-containing protein [Pseudooceanicola sediminis]|tara:strand:+ start:22617 stop:23597 length:981 start_codon:yes stop_codon:yes gene_type:complete